MIRTLAQHALVGSLLLTAACICLAAGDAAADGVSSSCCADLEERIAELEANTVRRGQRKVSVRISGQIDQAVLAWDDGLESNVYVVTNANSSDRFRITGEAQIRDGLSAGYYLEIGNGVSSSAGIDQLNDNAGIGPFVRQSLLYVASVRLGAVSIGLSVPATDDIIDYNLGGTSVAASANTALVGGNLFTRDASIPGAASLNSLAVGETISLRWRRFVPDLETRRGNIVRYDSPIIRGFVASAAWGEDDIWDVALRYAVKRDQFRFAAGIGYYEDRDEDENVFGWPGGGVSLDAGRSEIREVKGSASLLHEPTGLFASGAFVQREFSGRNPGVLTFACFPTGDAADIRNLGIGCSNRPDFDYWWVNGGIRRNWFSLGWTSVYGELARSEGGVDGLNVSVRSAVGGDIDYVTSSDMDIWGVGIVQNVASAAMEVYVSYRHFEADVRGLESSGDRRVAPLEDADLLMAGGRIRF